MKPGRKSKVVAAFVALLVLADAFGVDEALEEFAGAIWPPRGMR